jgi:hypothetical protein
MGVVLSDTDVVDESADQMQDPVNTDGGPSRPGRGKDGGGEGEGMMADSWDDLNRQWSAGSSFLCAAGRPDVESARSRAVVGREGREARQTPVRQRREEVPGAVLLRRTGKERAKWSRTAEGTSIQQPAASSESRGPRSAVLLLDGAVRGLDDEIKLQASGSASAEESSRGGRWRQGRGWWMLVVCGSWVVVWSCGPVVLWMRRARWRVSHSKRNGDRDGRGERRYVHVWYWMDVCYVRAEGTRCWSMLILCQYEVRRARGRMETAGRAQEDPTPV